MIFRPRFWIRLLLGLSIIWTGGFLYYISQVNGYSGANRGTADGIVILTGTPARLKLGFELLNSGTGKRLLISGVNAKVTRNELQRVLGESNNIMDCCVDLGRLAKDTVGNAYEASLWASEHGFEALLVVTSAYHMPRSLVEMKRQMPDKTLVAYVPEVDSPTLTGWWRRPAALYVLSGEFNKYIVSLLRARLEGLAMDGDPK
ncbi:YdcF family protein [Sneathiella chinensis]|uniref:DUF218 domain-containing protein n=1 Tax=Sneathiella chinensis TaxID=349750 RepID=A0ABQ5U0W7_9PROT|nr:YdcF family protein [Sneathiella chinensis]GLQ05315.1 hypothetical protein GCM10007924_05360 [Sneathiella chinensis]